MKEQYLRIELNQDLGGPAFASQPLSDAEKKALEEHETGLAAKIERGELWQGN